MIENKKIHFIGIGGISMSGLAILLSKWGNYVSGSDVVKSANTDKLEKKGIKVFFNHSADNIKPDTDLIVKTDAIEDDNPEIIEGKNKNISVWRRSKMIQKMAEDKKIIAVAGTHGKSTVTAMISKILIEAKFKPMVFIGADWKAINGTVKDGKGDWAVVEACEYKGSFWDLKPDIIVLTNVEKEHLDFYPDLGSIKESFVKFINNLKTKGKLVVYEGSRTALRVAHQSGKKFTTYGWGRGNDYQISKKLKLKVFGRYNRINAGGAIATAIEAGVNSNLASRVVSEFKGIDRRSQFLGKKRKISVYDDYGHHPTEIKVVLEAFKKRFPNRKVILVFQPHQTDRLKKLYKKFKKSLLLCDKLILIEAFDPVGRGEAKEELTEKLTKEIKEKKSGVYYCSDYDQALSKAKKITHRGSVLLTMGATNVNQVAERFLKKVK